MSDQALIDYVQKNLAAGFSEGEIRATLQKAGWPEADIAAAFAPRETKSPEAPLALPEEEEQVGFFGKYRRLLAIIIILLVAGPLVSYGGLFVYKKFFKAAPSAPPAPPPATELPETGTGSKEQPNAASKRDQQRLADIQTIQNALDNYFATNQFYPKALAELAQATYLENVPVDPRSARPYLYAALGEPVLNYSISFLLETDIGTLQAGLQVVTPATRLPAENIQAQEELIKGERTEILPALKITDLSVQPFYPQEEITLNITAPAGAELSSAALAAGSLRLTDRRAPWGFTFSAPRTPGQYDIQVFAFDAEGHGYFAETTLTVEGR